MPVTHGLAALLAALHLSGVVLVGRAGTPVFEHAYGLANRTTKAPNRLDTQFNVASLGKMFTGVAVAQLVQQGKMQFGDPVGRYLPGLPARIGKRVTVGQLLDHTSGLGDYFGDPGYDALRPRLKRLADYLPLIEQEQLAFRPGARFGYSNSGFILAGLVVEQVSGERFDVYLRRHVWRPAGMTRTSCTSGLRLDVPSATRTAAGRTPPACRRTAHPPAAATRPRVISFALRAHCSRTGCSIPH
jgi:CubicO group peptidase (beta-lactamase class C family)